jgi:hypothetical protein
MSSIFKLFANSSPPQPDGVFLAVSITISLSARRGILLKVLPLLIIPIAVGLLKIQA